MPGHRSDHARALAAVLALLAATALAISACGGNGEPRVISGGGSSEETSTGTETAEGSVSDTPLGDVRIATEEIATGFDQPLFVTGAGDGSGRLFVLEKTGRVWIVTDGERSADPFLDLSDAVSTDSEQGLLGMAFYPSFAEDGLLIVYYTDVNGDTVVSRFSASGDMADRASEEVLLKVDQPYANHNGGMVVFGTDGYLYIGLGDGGSGGDPHGNGQNTQVLLGKILRIDVTGDASQTQEATYGIPDDNPFVDFHPDTGAPRPEIWAFGLRNPWRFSFDRATGDLWIGDVGQSAWEEIDFQPASSGGGENYGWSRFEGTHAYPPDTDPPKDTSGFVQPVVEYARDAGKSVTGGYVYRGSEVPDLRGVYVYGDFVSGRVWGLRLDPGADSASENELLLDTGGAVSSFGEDDEGELYIVDFNGSVLKVVPD